MRWGGVLAQYGTDGGGGLDQAIHNLVGQLLGFLLVLAFAYWLMRRTRASRANRPPVSGWYADPWGAPYQRWWNGSEWTANVREHPWPGPPPGQSGPGGFPPPG
ncbi:MAG: hypothetical protein JWO77_1753 [Ilumatobacteraceae bacterium]|nr:hypothetical protein [Ilumatobacteraceae bacterium]